MSFQRYTVTAYAPRYSELHTEQNISFIVALRDYHAATEYRLLHFGFAFEFLSEIFSFVFRDIFQPPLRRLRLAHIFRKSATDDRRSAAAPRCHANANHQYAAPVQRCRGCALRRQTWRVLPTHDAAPRQKMRRERPGPQNSGREATRRADTRGLTPDACSAASPRAGAVPPSMARPSRAECADSGERSSPNDAAALRVRFSRR